MSSRRLICVSLTAVCMLAVFVALMMPAGSSGRPPAGSAAAAAVISGEQTPQASPPTTEVSTASDSTPADSSQNAPLQIDPPGPAPEGMVWIPGGTFLMGNVSGPPDEAPRHEVTLDGFWMDATEVTNAQFSKFVEATDYVTVAERKPKREDFAGQVEDINSIPEENLVAGSICFNSGFDRKTLRRDHPLWPYQIWQYVPGANWRHPEGPQSNLDDRQQHPVVHICWHDAQAYCEWAGKQLPTEAQWEYAARGGLAGKTYPWGDERNPEGRWLNNIWQGDFPFDNHAKDGFPGTAPVRQFPPNGYGLYAISGNVWEWCSDFYRPDYYARSPRRNPAGPSDSFDPNEPNMVKRVQRGGSFMCSDNYCIGYRVSARMKGEPSSSMAHCGLRCVQSPPPSDE